MFDKVLGIIAPHRCLQCGRAGFVWCMECRTTAPPVASRCYRCHKLSDKGRTCVTCRRRSALYAVHVATSYEGYAKQLVWRLKFGRARSAGPDAAALIVQRVELPANAVIVHIPTATSRVRRRGYDQAALIAQEVARQAKRPACPALMRIGRQQQRGQSRHQRLAQLDGAFVVREAGRVSGEYI